MQAKKLSRQLRIKASLVIPVLNESESVSTFAERALDALGNDCLIEPEIVFVNDGSSDATLDQLLHGHARA
ncbi:glycosyltransferase [Thauera mechernichensis]